MDKKYFIAEDVVSIMDWDNQKIVEIKYYIVIREIHEYNSVSSTELCRSRSKAFAIRVKELLEKASI